MATSTSFKRSAEGDRKEIEDRASNYTSGMSDNDIPTHEVNKPHYICIGRRIAANPTGITISVLDIWNLIAAQHPMLSEFLKNSDGNLVLADWDQATRVMCIDGYDIYALGGGSVIHQPNLNLSGTLYPSKQLYDVGVEGQKLSHLSYRWPEVIKRGQMITPATADSTILARISNETDCYMFFYLSIWSSTLISLNVVNPASVINVKKAKIKHIKDLTMPVMDAK